MKTYLSNLNISDQTGAELLYDKEEGRISFITSSGEFGYFDDEKISELIESDVVYYFHFKKNSIVVLASQGEYIYRFGIHKPEINILKTLNRTNLVNEGFDYEFFIELDVGALLAYEHGFIYLNDFGEIAWSREFENLMVEPTVCKEKIVYLENSETIIYSTSDGSLLERLPDPNYPNLN